MPMISLSGLTPISRLRESATACGHSTRHTRCQSARGQDCRVIEFALFAASLSVHQSRERIVGCGRAGGRTGRPRAIARVSAGHRALDRRCAEDWESLHAPPCQMRQAVLFPNPFCTSHLSTESKPNCHVALSRIPRSMIGVDENLCVHSPIVPNRCGRVSELGDECDGDRAHFMSVLLPPDQAKMPNSVPTSGSGSSSFP